MVRFYKGERPNDRFRWGVLAANKKPPFLGGVFTLW
jgi:hypothetical protein